MNEIEFKLKTDIGTIVYKIDLFFVEGFMKNKYDLGREKTGIKVQNLTIVHQTNSKIALSNSYITILDRQIKGEKKEFYKTFLDDISICVKTNDNMLQNGLFAHCYTLQNPEKMIIKIKSEIEDKIKNEYGWLNSSISEINKLIINK